MWRGAVPALSRGTRIASVPAKELSVNTRVVFIALGLAGLALFGTTVNETAAPNSVEETTQNLPTALPPAPPTRSVAALPTIVPPRETIVPSGAAPRAGYAAASLPSFDPQRSVTSLPTVTPAREPGPTKSTKPTRNECDPAYPDKRTCIPPGPPFGQGCAITEERRVTVLAPDPQELDHDRDGIGCEPVRR